MTRVMLGQMEQACPCNSHHLLKLRSNKLLELSSKQNQSHEASESCDCSTSSIVGVIVTTKVHHTAETDEWVHHCCKAQAKILQAYLHPHERFGAPDVTPLWHKH